MITLTRKIRLYLLAIITAGAGAYALCEVTSWQELQAVTLDGVQLENWSERLGLEVGGRVMEQPRDSIAARLLESSQTARVDIRFELPNGLLIETNRFESIGKLLDKSTGRLLGLDSNGRLVPLNGNHNDWEQPIVTGVSAGKIFEPSVDPRVVQLAFQLQELAADNIELFRLIDEIDLSSDEYATVTIAGLSFRLRTRTEDFFEQMQSFVDFLQKYQPDVSKAQLIDLRYANMVIQKAKRN